MLSVESMDSETRHWLTMMVFFVGFSCPPQYVGEYCQFANPCHTGPGPRCQNGGSCAVRLSSNAVPSFSCSCPLGFSASLCEIPVPNVCDAAPCRHGGTCQLRTLDNYTCACPTGFRGPKCEAVDHCAQQPCKNGAQCNSLADAYRCTCAPGFTGPTCDTDIDECKKNPCFRGRCSNTHGSYKSVSTRSCRLLSCANSRKAALVDLEPPSWCPTSSELIFGSQL